MAGLIKPIKSVWRARRYSLRGHWMTWNEECPVIKQSDKYLYVTSETYPNSPLYPGGTFRLELKKLRKDGKIYHSRHGEYFYLNRPSPDGLFPSEYILNSPDPIKAEITHLGWDIKSLTDFQRDCVVTAIIFGTTIEQAKNQIEMGEFNG